MKTTEPLLKVAEVFMSEPCGRFWGYDIGQRVDLRSGVLYPLLHRLRDAGWLTDMWEEPPSDGRRRAPARRCYELTEVGAERLGALLAARPAFDAEVAKPSWVPRPA